MTTKEKDIKGYEDTPAGQAKRWASELTAAKGFFRRWHKEADKVVKKFLDERTQEQDEWGELTTRLNLFHANITTLMSMLYGKIPKVEVDRRFADADDNAARVAGMILTRVLNTDIEEAGEDMASVFRQGLQDRLLPGLGSARVQYQCNTKKQQVPPIHHPQTGELLAEGYEEEIKDTEWTDIVYTHWKDILWNQCRTHGELRWKAYRSYMDKEAVLKRFPDADLSRINFNEKGPVPKSRGEKQYDINPQAEIWEIWSRSDHKVYWYTEGIQEILDEKEDPLQLRGFWSEPPPFIANLTTTKFLPKSDYSIAQDLYRDIDKLQTRISLLTDACKLVGIYDKSQESIKRIFTEGIENDLIPVDNWAMFAEKGGLKGLIDWVPLDAVTNTIAVLTEKQNDKVAQLYQVTGMNDIMRGAAQSSDRTSATRDQLEASYGSIRVEALQNEFARWVGDLQALKVEIIARFYDPQTILEQSNVMATEDAQYAQEAIALIKNTDQFRWRVTVRPETLAIADYAQLKQDRTEYINALALFMQSAAPLLQMDPGSLPSLLKLLKWGLAGFRGSNEIEGVIDQDIARLEKQPPQQKPDPAMAKAQADMQMAAQDHQAKMQQNQQKAQQDMQVAQQDHEQKVAQNRDKHAQEMKQNAQEFQLKIAEMQQQFKIDMSQMMTDMVTSIRKEAEAARFGTLEKASGEAISVESDKRRNGGDSSSKD